ncbi:kanadaptin-like [Actinia tenebrosa]|uniref:Kanadaptin-like n=1 Tax=Actinia tenebrosa TaxID=6105 RepID=A0A6P8IG81_ACTTE|nr:kanadaptin-like [Actinia tenebrosa]
MADEEEKVVEEKCEQNEEIRTEMLPPELPKSVKNKVNSNEPENRDPKSEKDGEGTAKMAPPSQGTDVKSEKDAIESKKKLEDKKETFPEIPYKEPSWSGIPDEPYYLELLKGGCIKSTKYLTEKPYYLFGRLPNCDLVMEHPSISRYHAIIQYKASETGKSDKGYYLYDLGSTHGTVVNKVRIEPRRYYRLRVGYVMKFGGSSRLYILQGPEEVEEDEEMIAEQREGSAKHGSEVGRVMSEEEYEEWKQQKEKKPEEKDEGISWGFGEDAVEEDAVNPFASELEVMETHEFKDPKKTLRGYFEREGLDLEYQVEETGPGHARVYHCRVKLPVETATGDPLYAEAAVTGKKREAVLACAAEACRILDMNGLLRQSSHESKKQKMKNWEENDYYDSDEDTFLDRTGSIEMKRIKRMKTVKKDKEETETFESLSSKLKSVEEEIASLETKLQEAMEASKAAKENEDSLDLYMKSIDKCMDKTARMQMRRKIYDLKKEKQLLAKLVKVAQPTSLPELLIPKLSSKEGVQEINKKLEEKKISTPGVATSTASQEESTTGVGSSIRHERAVLDDKASSKDSISSHDPNRGTTGSDKHGSIENSEKEIESKTTKFAMPALPSLKSPKPKPKKVPPPDSSLSRVLEGLKSSTTNEKDTRKERRFKKHQAPEEQSGAFQEMIEKKKRKIMPQYSPSSPPPSPPAPTQTESLMDENYSDWIPPTDQSGDGRTKLNEKYGY